MRPDDDARDVELRLVDPSKNRFRLYGLTECRTLFGELCLRIVWGRIGNRRLRERSETFTDPAALARRRAELLARRRRHGYVDTTARAGERAAGAEQHASPPLPFMGMAAAVDRATLEAHGLPVEDTAARALVRRWYAATTAIIQHLEKKGAEVLDLVDASTLASLFVGASAIT